MKKRLNRIFEHLRRKTRLTAVDPETYEEHWHWNVTPLNAIYVILAILLLTAMATYFLIAYTGLKAYITEADGGDDRTKALEMEREVRQMEARLQMEIAYWENMRARLLNEAMPDSMRNDSILNRSFDPDTITFVRSKEDSLLRLKIDKQIQDKLNRGIPKKSGELSGIMFYPPVQGTVLKPFKPEDDWFGVLLNLQTGSMVYAVQEGTVVFNNSNEIHVQHNNALVTIYKGLGTVLKFKGEPVKTGEVVAETENKKQITFEMWHRGRAVDPENYIIFTTYGD